MNNDESNIHKYVQNSYIMHSLRINILLIVPQTERLIP